MSETGQPATTRPSLPLNVLTNVGSQVWNAAMSMLFVPVYVRYMGVESYGLIGVFGILHAWLSLLDMGMKPALSREMARFGAGAVTPQGIRDLLRTVETVTGVFGLVSACSVALASHWLATHWLRAEALPIEAVARAFTVMGTVTGIRFVESVYASSLTGLQRQVILNAVSSASATLRGLGAIAILEWVSPTIEAFFVWQALVALLSLVVMASVTYGSIPRAPRPARASLESLREVGKFAGGMLSITVLASALTQLDKAILANLLPLSEYAHYSLAVTAASLVLFVGAPISQAWAPRLSALQAEGNEAGFSDVYHRGAQLVAVAIGSPVVVLIVYAEPLVTAWTRDPELAGHLAPLIQLLAVGNLLNSLMWMPSQAQFAHGWTGLSNIVNLTAVALIVPTLFVVAPRYGPIGAACVWISVNVYYSIVYVTIMHRRILKGEMMRFYIQDSALPIFASATAGWLASRVVPSFSGPLVLVTASLVGIAALCAGAAITPTIRARIVERLGRRAAGA
ncbi:MAG: lipopolysaccharide biosynthesis protein [Sandaracinaceae bacterium]|nr:lipopolysaccharide biosynthesis protein [Sandaracinaceae bacterium]